MRTTKRQGRRWTRVPEKIARPGTRIQPGEADLRAAVWPHPSLVISQVR